MASLVKRSDGNYGLIWTDRKRYPENPQTRESLKTSNFERAKKLKSKLENAYNDGEHIPWERKWYDHRQPTEDGISLFDAVEEFITYKTEEPGSEGWSETIAKNETWFMRMFCKHLGPNTSVRKITPDDLKDFYYRKGVNSDHTRDSNFRSVNTFLNWCVKKRGYIKEKPIYKPGKPQAKIPKFIYPKELAQIIWYKVDAIHKHIKNGTLEDETRGAYWVPLGWMVLAGTGMRPDELAGLDIRQVEQGSVLIGESFTTKDRAERRVPLLFESQQAIDVLTDPRFRSKDPYMSQSNYLLGRSPSYAKKELSREFSKAWKKVHKKKAHRTLYNLKDMFCVRFLTDDSVPTRGGIKINDLKEILGHESLNTTQKYLKAVPFGTSIEGTIWDYVPESVWSTEGKRIAKGQHMESK